MIAIVAAIGCGSGESKDARLTRILSGELSLEETKPTDHGLVGEYGFAERTQDVTDWCMQFERTKYAFCHPVWTALLERGDARAIAYSEPREEA